MLKAIGKYIDTLPLTNLISFGEKKADVVPIEVDRFYDSLDLAEFTFMMRGVTESGAETQTELQKMASSDGNYIHLTWYIGSLFTAEPGRLFLDLYAYRYEPDTPGTEPPDEMIRYQLPPVEIRKIPEGTREATDKESYEAFWPQVKRAITALEHRIQIMTREEYDELEDPDPDVIYILTEEEN